jgi:Type II CAAX prenyl endopeptidase Rce1-like
MARARPGLLRDFIELVLGYGMILGVIWAPDSLQRVLAPVVLVATALIILARREGRDELGLGSRGLVSSMWILLAAVGVTGISVVIAWKVGTLHPLYADAGHAAGYVLWTLYQQLLLQDYFAARLVRMVSSQAAAVGLAALLFATAHLPNLSLTAATLVWGVISCALFRRYRNLYVLGLAQGLLGLCFAACVPNAWHHHMHVGLGYLQYRGR